MLYSGLVFRRFCGSAGLCRQFTSGNLLQTYSKIPRFNTGLTIREFCASSVHHSSALGVTPGQDGAKNQADGERATEKRPQDSDHPGSLPDNTRSEAQGGLNNTSTEMVAIKDKAELSRLRKYINRFFAKYPTFDYDPAKPYTEEFIRMAEMFGWDEDSEEYKIARRKLNTASVLQFNKNFDKESQPKDKKKKPKLEEMLKKSKSGDDKKEPKPENKKSKVKKKERAKENETGKLTVKEKEKEREKEKEKEKAKERAKESAEEKAKKKEKAKAREKERKKEEEEELRKWVKLFGRIDIKDPVLPITAKGFEKRVKSVHTNICDVLDADVTGIKSKDWGNEASTTPKDKANTSKQKSSSGGRKKRSQAELRTHLEAFFAQPEYAGFKYNPAKPYMEEFYSMTKQFGWNSKGTEEQQEKFQAAREGINRASVLQFNAIFGKDENDTAAWRNLCSVLDIAKIPKSRSGCKKLVKLLHINICDLVDSPARGTKARHHDTEAELSAYTKRTGKFFPQEDAEAGGLLKYLLRHILHPPTGKSPYPRPELRK